MSENKTDITTGGRLIKDLTTDERPREKAIKHGFDSLTDAELMAIIFSTGIKGKSVIDLCRDILADNGNHLSKIGKMTVSEMCRKYKGIGKVKAITILAALQLGKRMQKDAATLDNRSITDPSKAYDIMQHHFDRLNHEEFWIMLLDRAAKNIREVRISHGGTSATVVDVKIIVKEAIDRYASSLLLFHNHPSGTLRPSVEDDRITNKIVDACRLFDIRVNDHIIVTDNGYYSYAEHGRL